MSTNDLIYTIAAVLVFGMIGMVVWIVYLSMECGAAIDEELTLTRAMGTSDETPAGDVS